MANLNDSPALWAIYHTTQAIEGLGCGEAFTAAAVQSSEALRLTQAEVDRRIAAERRASEEAARATRAETLAEERRLALVSTLNGLEQAAKQRDDLTARLADSDRALAEARDAQRRAEVVLADFRNTPCLSELLGEDVADDCGCMGCQSRRYFTTLARPSPAPTTPTHTTEETR
jgi:hypothetical protein